MPTGKQKMLKFYFLFWSVESKLQAQVSPKGEVMSVGLDYAVRSVSADLIRTVQAVIMNIMLVWMGKIYINLVL